MSDFKDVSKEICQIEKVIMGIRENLKCEHNVKAFSDLQELEGYYFTRLQNVIDNLQHPLYDEAIKYIIEEGYPNLNENICSYLCQSEYENHICEMCCKNQKGGSMNKNCVERFLHLRMLKRTYSETENKC
jgi:hypothetical protein